MSSMFSVSTTDTVDTAGTADTFSADSSRRNEHQQKRRKRSKYVNCACLQCKRRKIKCNGLNPCQRCSNMHLSCVYPVRKGPEVMVPPPSTNSSLNQQLDAMEIPEPSLLPQISLAVLNNSASPTYGLPPSLIDGIEPNCYFLGRKTVDDQDDTRVPVDVPLPPTPGPSQVPSKRTADDCGLDGSDLGRDTYLGAATGGHAQAFEEKELAGIPYSDAMGLLDLWDMEINCLYPIFGVGELQSKLERILSFYSANGRLEDGSEDDMRNIKLCISIASSVASNHVLAGKLLVDDVSAKYDRYVMSRAADISSIIYMILIHQFQFHSDMGLLAYKTLGCASVLALEMGLHSSKELDERYSAPVQKEYCRLLFWCLYCMDRRLAIYTKRPCLLRDEEIDQKLPQYTGGLILPSRTSEDDMFRALHLNYMIHYSQLTGKILEFISSKRHSTATSDSIQYWIFLLHQWQTSLPAELKLKGGGGGPSPKSSGKLKWIMYLKSNLMLLHIYRCCTSNMLLQPAINTARDCIRELGQLYFNTDFYGKCEIQYNHYLVAALDVLYSSIRQAPQYLTDCMPEIKLALKIVSLILKNSNYDKRQGSIWQLVVSFAFKFGLASPFGQNLISSESDDSYSGDRTFDYTSRVLLADSL